MSAQNVPQMPEEVENRCGICFEDVKKTGDFFGLLDCCGHIHCWECIRQWKHQQESQKIRPSCPCCRKKMGLLFASLIVISHDETDRKESFVQFTDENTPKVREWAARMQSNGMKVEKCEFNCGFAEVMLDGSLMCPHGYYDEKIYEEENRTYVDQGLQFEPLPFFVTPIVANSPLLIDIRALPTSPPNFYFVDPPMQPTAEFGFETPFDSSAPLFITPVVAIQQPPIDVGALPLSPPKFYYVNPPIH